ncbi:MAG: hypothetical protein IJ512_04220, partial [Ruminococcus sp.]|nr:hypothetical protein [Ruminococcus sp.]
GFLHFVLLSCYVSNSAYFLFFMLQQGFLVTVSLHGKDFLNAEFGLFVRLKMLVLQPGHFAVCGRRPRALPLDPSSFF